MTSEHNSRVTRSTRRSPPRTSSCICLRRRSHSGSVTSIDWPIDAGSTLPPIWIATPLQIAPSIPIVQQQETRARKRRRRPSAPCYMSTHCDGMPQHSDFNKQGPWIGCASYNKIAAQLANSGMAHLHPMLKQNFRAGSNTMIGRESAHNTRPSNGSSGSSRYCSSDSRTSTRDSTRDNTRDNRTSGVRFDNRGIQPTMISLAHISCDCDAQDIDTTYRMCCVTDGNSPSYSAATLLVNREVAAWIVQQSMTSDGATRGKRKVPAMLATST